MPRLPRRGHAPVASLGMAAGAGAVAIVLVLLALWLKGWLPLGGGGVAAADKRIAALEQQVSELRGAQTAQPAANDDALAARVGKIEAALAKLPPNDTGVAAKLAAADNAMKSLGLALTALSHRTDDASADAAAARKAADAAVKAVGDLQASMQQAAASNANTVPRADIEALDRRVAALETQVKATHEALTKSSGNDNAARLALSAAVLRDAVAVGAPYADELAAVRALGGDAKALEPLAAFAATGAPTAQTLAHDLSALGPQMQKIAGAPPPSGDFLAKLEANASRLVRVRPVSAPKGDEPSAVLARLEVDAANNDIAAALTDLAELPEKVRAPASAWLTQAQARQAALAAARQYAAATARALKPQ